MAIDVRMRMEHPYTLRRNAEGDTFRLSPNDLAGVKEEVTRWTSPRQTKTTTTRGNYASISGGRCQRIRPELLAARRSPCISEPGPATSCHVEGMAIAELSFGFVSAPSAPRLAPNAFLAAR